MCFNFFLTARVDKENNAPPQPQSNTKQGLSNGSIINNDCPKGSDSIAAKPISKSPLAPRAGRVFSPLDLSLLSLTY
jgi:hypothetical protein